MKYKKFVIITFFVILIVFVIQFFFFNREKELKKEAKKIISTVEEYKVLNGVCPQSLSDVGLSETENGPLFYQRKDSFNYIIYFGQSLGESQVYDSKSKNWEIGYK